VEKDEDKEEIDKKTNTETIDQIEKKEFNTDKKESNLIECPSCHAEIASDKKFCTKCGTSLTLESDSNHHTNNNQDLDKNIDTIKTSGKELMKGLGGILDKTAATLDEKLAQQKSSPTSKEINEKLRKKREEREFKPGYLVCDSCGGYYELQTGETPDDFSDECECGGKLGHYHDLPE
jgi:rRNA maturation endonuclease Nob1